MSEAPGLIRALRRRDLIGLIVNGVVGAGMLAAPSKVFALAHGWSFVILACAALLIAPLILIFADLGSRFTTTGGPYLYARAALPGWMAFAVGWMLWISQALAVATLSNLLVSYLGGLFPVVGSGLPRAAIIVGLGIVLTAIVLVGIRQSATSSNVLVLLKVAFILGFVVAGIGFVDVQKLAVASPTPSVITTFQAILIYLFAYTGFERAGLQAGETRDPRRDVPITMFASVGLASVIYAAVLFVCIGVLGDPTLTDRPLAEVGRLLFGPIGQIAVSVGAIVVILGTLMALVVAMPRLLMAMAEQGQLPAVMGAVHERSRTPHVAIIISSGLAFAAALGSDLLASLTISTAARVVVYILCCIALFRLSRRADSPPPQFRLPMPAFITLTTAVLFAGVLVLGAVKELPALLTVMAIGLLALAATHLARSHTARVRDLRNSS